LIEKMSKNNVCWKGDEDHLERVMEKQLDSQIRRAQQIARSLANKENAALAFLRCGHIRQVQQFASQTLIAIKAPPNTTMELASLTESDQLVLSDSSLKPCHQIFLKSSAGPIDLYLVDQQQSIPNPPSLPNLPSVPDSFSTSASHMLPLSSPLSSSLSKSCLGTKAEWSSEHCDYVENSPDNNLCDL